MLVARDECFRCMKPKRLCLCERIPKIPNRTHVLVVQHPRERAHPIGTARFVELGLESSEVVVAYDLDAEPAMRSIEGRRAVLLHPSATSRSLDSFLAGERPEVLVVVDGTWPNARTLVRENAALAALPHVHLEPASPSRYRIRREPSETSVSTIEATLLALAALEPDLDPAPLLAAFDSMIDDQIAQHGGTRSNARRRRHSRAFVGVPEELGERFESLVLVYAESSLRDEHGVRAILRISAVHPATGETFDAYVRPARPDVPIAPGLPELVSSRDADPVGVVATRFGAWLETFESEGPVSIGAFSGELARRVAALADRPSFELGAAYRAMRGKGQGMLDAIVVAEGIDCAPLPFEGRAGLRLGHAHGLATWLRSRALERASARVAAASDERVDDEVRVVASEHPSPEHVDEHDRRRAREHEPADALELGR